MTREQANIIAETIFDESNKKKEEIINKAIKNGTWLPGLDSNKQLFVDIDNETKTKLKELAKQIDD